MGLANERTGITERKPPEHPGPSSGTLASALCRKASLRGCNPGSEGNDRMLKKTRRPSRRPDSGDSPRLSPAMAPEASVAMTGVLVLSLTLANTLKSSPSSAMA